MIDIFAMLVIFLLKCSYFGAVDMDYPDKLKLPESVSKETLESTPRVIITSDGVSIPFLKSKSVITGDLEAYRATLHAYVSKLPKDVNSTLSVVADKEVPYRRIYDVVKVFREAGFGNILFVASSRNEQR